MKNKKIFALILIFVALILVGCQNNNKIEILNETNPSNNYMCFSVYGKDDELIIDGVYVKSNYKKNISVADLTKDICRELEIPAVLSGIGTMAYLQGINNLFEFDHGAESGWLYAVNGEYQSVGCGSYILQDKDYVEWHYTLDLGKDLGAFKLDE